MSMNRLKVSAAAWILFGTLGVVACSDEGLEMLDEGIKLEKRHDYEGALASYATAAVAASSEANEQAQARLDSLRARTKHAEAAISDARGLAAKRDWSGAVSTLEDARAELPDHPPLEQALAEMLAEFEANRLGGGFREAVWGSGIAEVKLKLGGTIDTEDSDFLLVKPANGGKIKCWFYQGGLYRVEFNPGLSDSDATGVDAIRAVMADKYGKPKPLSNMQSSWGAPLMVETWEDSKTEIRFSVVRPSSLLPRTASTAVAIYSSKSISSAKQRGEDRKRAEDEDEAMQSSKNRYDGAF